MRKKYKTLDELRASNARRQREWRKNRMARLGLKPGKRGRKPKNHPAPKSRKRGLDVAIV